MNSKHHESIKIEGRMTQEEFAKAEAFLILKYGTIDKAIDYWLETDKEEEDGFDMLDFYMTREPKDIRE